MAREVMWVNVYSADRAPRVALVGFTPHDDMPEDEGPDQEDRARLAEVLEMGK